MSLAGNNAVFDIEDKSDMYADAVSHAKHAVENIKVQWMISKYIKQKFDEKYGANWHCVVGKNFASYVSHQMKSYLFFYEGQIAICLYKL